MVIDLLVNIEANIFTIESIICFILLFAGLILFSQDFKIGVITNFIIFLGVFVLFYVWGWNYRLPLIISMGWLVMLSLSLYYVNKTTKSAGFI